MVPWLRRILVSSSQLKFKALKGEVKETHLSDSPRLPSCPPLAPRSEVVKLVIVEHLLIRYQEEVVPLGRTESQNFLSI